MEEKKKIVLSINIVAIPVKVNDYSKFTQDSRQIRRRALFKRH